MPDEAGCGESAGAITDWGFAYADDAAFDAEGNVPEPEYSDDEDFEPEPDSSGLPPSFPKSKSALPNV